MAISFAEVRCAESSKIRGKYQDRIPVSYIQISKDEREVDCSSGESELLCG